MNSLQNLLNEGDVNHFNLDAFLPCMEAGEASAIENMITITVIAPPGYARAEDNSTG